MKDIVMPIIIALVSSNTLLGLIQFIINRNDYIKKIESRLAFIDQGSVRTQLLILIADYPDRVDEIMKLAKKYFVDFKGNYYLTSLFKKYLDDSMLTYPQWFNVDNH